MTPKAMVAAFREEAHDNRGTTEEEYLWKTPFLLRALNEARTEAVRRGRLLEDFTTPEVCKLTVRAGVDTLTIDPRVIYIRRVKHSLIDRPLAKTYYKDLDEFHPGWESYDDDEPRTWVPWGDHKIRLVPTPDADATINLVVVREPLADVTIASSEEEVELEPRYHFRLVNFMCARAYMQRDLIEKYRPEEARDHMALFDSMFGEPESAALEKWNARRHGYDEYEGLR